MATLRFTFNRKRDTLKTVEGANTDNALWYQEEELEQSEIVIDLSNTEIKDIRKKSVIKPFRRLFFRSVVSMIGQIIAFIIIWIIDRLRS